MICFFVIFVENVGIIFDQEAKSLDDIRTMVVINRYCADVHDYLYNYTSFKRRFYLSRQLFLCIANDLEDINEFIKLK